jgi:hypothetical protein
VQDRLVVSFHFFYPNSELSFVLTRKVNMHASIWPIFCTLVQCFQAFTGYQFTLKYGVDVGF